MAASLQLEAVLTPREASPVVRAARNRQGRGISIALVLVAISAYLSGAAGCRWSGSRGRWDEPLPPSPQAVRQWHDTWRQTPIVDCGTRQLLAAVDAEQAGGQSAAGLYYQAALASGRALDCPNIDGETQRIACRVHQASVKGLLIAAGKGTDAAPGECLFVTINGKITRIPVAVHGFAWVPSDFQQLHVVESYQTETLTCVYRRPGVGVPVVLQRMQRTGSHHEEQFLPERSTFAATVVLRPGASNDDVLASNDAEATLEFYNPRAILEIDRGGQRMALAADLSAPLAYQAIREAPRLNPITWFINPDAAGGVEGLYFLEPYQRGKIPIVFVHGLLSNPSTWIDMANELRATPDFDDRFQIWAFRYATGGSFLRAAVQLRRALYEAAETIDPRGQDTALRSTVLVGHSMGGLVSKLQVVESHDVLWRAVAARPFDQIVADAPTRRELAEALFVEPHPNVRRVVFLAVPHEGSSWAARPVGRVASAVVQLDDQRSELHKRLIADNPGVFAPEFERRLPTSIDMLKPENPLLQAIRRLPVASHVRANSVIGTGGMFSAVNPGDGVVPVDSARHGQVESETYVDATHEHVHRHPETMKQMRAILWRHWAEYSAGIAKAN